MAVICTDIVHIRRLYNFFFAEAIEGMILLVWLFFGTSDGGFDFIATHFFLPDGYMGRL